MVVRGLSDGERSSLAEQLDRDIEPFAGDGAYELPGVVLCAAAS